MKYLIAIVVFLALAVVAKHFGQSHTSEQFAAAEADKQKAAENRAKRECDNRRGAFRAANDFLEERLKAPKTADFASIKNSVVTNLGDCRHQVTSYVDSQNSFGAMLRTKYSATVKYSRTEEGWILEALETD